MWSFLGRDRFLFLEKKEIDRQRQNFSFGRVIEKEGILDEH
jgi:hypothetical protein